MKNFSNLVLLACTLLLTMGLFACGEDSAEDVTSVKEDFSVSSTYPESKGEVDAASCTKIQLDYQPLEVKVNQEAAITLNGQPVKARRSVALTSLVEIAVELKPDTEYELVVPAGSVLALNDPSRTARKLSLKFRTKKIEENPGSVEISARTLVQALGFGWNLGNHFDSFDENNAKNNYRITWSSTPYWDGVRPKQDLYTNLAAAGIKTVRVCVTWGPYQNMEDGKYTIDTDYMSEVQQNVDWALEAGLNVVLNTHHDEYWQDITTAASNGEVDSNIRDRITKTWTQIAEHYKNYNQHLIFETFNELHDDAWGWKAGFNYRPIYSLMDKWNQVAVDAIRATGGENATRWIGVPGFCANHLFTDGEKNMIVLPKDPANHIMVAVHTYDPFDFCTQGTVGRWGHTYKGNDTDENALKHIFEQLKREFIDKGVPCYMGEFGCETRLDAKDEPYRTYFMEYLCRTAYFNGIPVMLWDNNNNNQGQGGAGECFWYVNHLNGELNTPELIKTMVDAATSTNSSYTVQSVYNKAPK